MTKLVCFDLDGTLIREVHSVMFLCILNETLEALLKIEKRESEGRLHWVEADYLKAALIAGLPENRLHEEFDRVLKPLSGIVETVDALRQRNIRSVVITAGPEQVARAAQGKWGIDAAYGSDYEVLEGRFTGKITSHVGDVGKVSCLQACCAAYGIEESECVAVGDGLSDIPLFGRCGTSIALNASPPVAEQAMYSLRTESLKDVLLYLDDFRLPVPTYHRRGVTQEKANGGGEKECT